MHSSNKSGNSDTSSVRLHDQVLEQCDDKAHRSQPALPRPAAMLKPLENV
jgi:hypothetical protein